jgi:hypothetical protein
MNLHCFDLDDTLFETTAKVSILKNKKFYRYLRPSEYTNYVLDEDEEYCYKEFECSNKFFMESRPIIPIVNIMNKLSKRKDCDVIINTARSDLDNKELFLKKFRIHDIDIDNIHVERAGNIENCESVSIRKTMVIAKYLKLKSYKKVFMYDDSTKNLQSILDMNKYYNSTKFIGYHVQNGILKSFKQER